MPGNLIHADDNGQLSIFVSGDGKGADILFVCSERHWWTIPTADFGKVSKAATKRGAEGNLIDDPARKDDRVLLDLSERFGAGVLDVMSFK